jgi:hypothetical protein
MMPWHANYFKFQELREQQMLEEALPQYFLLALSSDSPRKKTITTGLFPEFS